jgi:hypothetical protein
MDRKTLLIVGDIICMTCLIGLAAFSYLQGEHPDVKAYQALVIVFMFVYIIGF